ncbi:Peptide-N(4)-(N-acetyl-beta-glucosaminyl)asparagine amidase [Heracleum sosnowskyi]|uniref:Peptide-N(4)-(N-acetyl-beta-glucosaminyl)asparagine amidase n=1 Tax=Heracleum sosnowskyi TaxID=360622 RepID=A0AAD8JCF2_9APIA|nr:Peptide-N(4)-(N-acetyl-beta-glucosaminyl)asparagine amidase [Heracleum sosnowskyi]
MVGRKFVVHHRDSTFDVDYDPNDGLEVLKFQLFSLTTIPPDEQKIFGGDGDQVVVGDSDLDLVSDKLRLVSISDEEEKKDKQVVDFEKSDEEFARMLQEEEDRLMLQQVVVSEEKGVIEQRIRTYINQVLMYEDPHRQDVARKSVPVETLEEKAAVALAKVGNFTPSKSDQDHAFLLQLLFWFKTSFRWVHAPDCDGCGNETVNHGMGVADPSETRFGASRVELYRCRTCSRITRFPRYNDPLKLLETRKGRCGEWANCFTLYCRAFGYDSRLIMDFTDHVWTECFLPSLGRWMHLDPCEGIYDNPLLYEKGWNKNLTYIIAIAKDGAYDVTKRYTRKWHEVLRRRNLTSEPALSSFLSDMRSDCRKNFTSLYRSELEERANKEADALEKDLYSKDDSSISLPGRLSGDEGWRLLRLEIGPNGNSSLSTSSCPVRECIDEHVTKIYNAFSPLIVHMVDQSYSKSKTVEILNIVKRILANIKKSPFRNRRTSIDLASNVAKHFASQTLPYLGELFDALSLKTETDAIGKVDVCLAADPVKTALALPVVFHALDDVIQNVNRSDKFNRESLAWPLLKLNRLCSGSVLASSEELPFGIVTSAFDGTRMTKWEEPNGAKGCWIIYKIPKNQFHELVAYELMSANDAPERDPMNWILEGSKDGGSTWHTLDEQTNQIFVNRFQRKTFRIAAQPILLNTYRLRFLSVRDVQATSRLQIGSIDLYAKGDISYSST